jgi:hypothetical protein
MRLRRPVVSGPLLAGYRPGVPDWRPGGAGRAERCSAAHCTIGISTQQYLAAVGSTHARPADTAVPAGTSGGSHPGHSVLLLRLEWIGKPVSEG